MWKGGRKMGIGASIFLIALGAVLTFALNGDTQVAGLNLDTVGVRHYSNN